MVISNKSSLLVFVFNAWICWFATCWAWRQPQLSSGSIVDTTRSPTFGSKSKWGNAEPQWDAGVNVEDSREVTHQLEAGGMKTDLVSLVIVYLAWGTSGHVRVWLLFEGVHRTYLSLYTLPNSTEVHIFLRGKNIFQHPIGVMYVFIYLKCDWTRMNSWKCLCHVDVFDSFY